MIRHLVEYTGPAPANLNEDFEQLVHDMEHGSGALMHMISNDGDPSQIWWLAERMCEQARMLSVRFHQKKRGSDAAGSQS